MKRKFVVYLSLLLWCLSLAGCASMVKPPTGQGFAPLPAPNEPLDESVGPYTMQAGDLIDIKFYYNPELNDQVKVRPDGKISLQLIDEVSVTGLTPVQLDNALTERYKAKLSKADIAVIVKEFAGQKVYVGGEVNAPGVVPIMSNQTSLQTILMAGGVKNTAEMRSVVIIRYQGTNRPLFFVIDLQQNLTPSSPANDILLRPYDIVFVPKSTIAKVNQFVEQYIDKLIPISRSLGLSYNLNPEINVQ